MSHLRTTQPTAFESRDWQALRKGWPAVALTGLAAGVLTWVYLSVVAPVYEAEVRVVVQNLGLGVEKSTLSKGYEKQFLATQAEVIRSPATINRSLRSLPYSGALEPDDDPLGLITKSLRVTPLANTDIVRIVYQHPQPAEATARLKSIVESYREHLRQVEQSSASQSVELLARRASELNNQIHALQQDLVRARASTTDSVAGETINDNPLLKELTGRWVATQAELLAAATDVRDLELGHTEWMMRQSTPLVHELTTLERDLIAARSSAAEISRVYGPAHPERRAIDERLATLQSGYQARVTQAARELRGQHRRLTEQEQSLHQLIVNETSRLRTAHGAQLDADRLQAEIVRLTELHASTSVALESVRLADQTLAEGRSSVVVNVLDEFIVPETPVWPKPVPLTVVAVLLGAILSAIGVVAMDRWRHPSLVAALTVSTTASGLNGTTDRELERSVRSQVANLHQDIADNYARRSSLEPQGALAP